MNKKVQIKKWSKAYFIYKMQERMAFTAFGVSAMRKQLKPGVLKKLQKYCSKINLMDYGDKNYRKFDKMLTRDTNALKRKKAEWGSARKAINLFLRDCAYNKYLSKKYKLNKVEKKLELPLDKKVKDGLRLDVCKKIAEWVTIKGLEHDQNTKFQKEAQEIAKIAGISRIHLDLKYWNANKQKES